MKLLFENWRQYVTERKELIQEFKQSDKEALMAVNDRFTVSYEIEILSHLAAPVDSSEPERPSLEQYAARYIDEGYFSESAGERDFESFVEYTLLYDYDADGNGLVDRYVADEIASVLAQTDEEKDRQIVQFEISIRELDGRALFEGALKSISKDGSPEANAFIELLLSIPAIKEELAEFTETKATQLGMDLKPGPEEEERDKLIHVLSGIDNTELFRRYVFDIEAEYSGFPEWARDEGKLISLEDFFGSIEMGDELTDALYEVETFLEGQILELGEKYATMNSAWNLSSQFRESDSEHLKEIASMVETAAETYMEEEAQREWLEYQDDPVGWLSEMGYEIEEQYEERYGPIYDEYDEDEFDEPGMRGLMRKYLPNFMSKYADQISYDKDASLSPAPHVEFSMKEPIYIQGLEEAFDFLELFFKDFENQDNFYMDERTGLHTNVGYLDDEGESVKEYNLMKALLFLNRDFATKGFETRRGSRWAGPIKHTAIEEIATMVNKELTGPEPGEPSRSDQPILKNFVEKNFDVLEKTLSSAVEFSVRHTPSKNLGFNIHYVGNRGYVEFRYPGDDTLDFETMKNTTLYYAHIIKTAADPEYKRSEYVKKLIGFINNLKHVEYEKVTSFDQIKGLKKGQLLTLPISGHQAGFPQPTRSESIWALYKYMTSEREREAYASADQRLSNRIQERDLWPNYYVYKGISPKTKSVILEYISFGAPNYMIAEKEIPMIFFERQLKELTKPDTYRPNPLSIEKPVEKLILGMFEVLRETGGISVESVFDYYESSGETWELRSKLKSIAMAIDRGNTRDISREGEELYEKYLDEQGNVNFPTAPPTEEQQALRQQLRKLRVSDEPLQEGILPLEEDIDFSTLQLKDTLEPSLWKNDELNSEIKEKLKEIALDFWEKTELTDVDIIDIIITGSIANYNWTQYSDIDLHIIIDLAQVDDNVDLVNRFFRHMSAGWNRAHKIMIKGHEVEIYVQGANEVHASTGMYSVLNGYWTVKPSKTKVRLDKEAIRRKAEVTMEKIDAAKKMYDGGEYEEAHDTAVEIKEKIRNMRRCGLTDGGEFSAENLAFKVLRRNGYLAKLSELKNDAYDLMMSLDGVRSSAIRIRIG